MKNTITLFSAFIISVATFGQSLSSPKWSVSPDKMQGHIQAFIVNNGQFMNPVNNWTVYYGANCGGTEILLTSRGIIYRVPQQIAMTEEEIKQAESKEKDAQKEQEEHETKYKTIYHNVTVEWVGANASPSVEARGKTGSYFGSVNPTKAAGINNIPGYSELVYHNLYPGIDVDFTFHTGEGIEYTLHVKPGYDAAAFKMLYSGQQELTLTNGNLHITTPAGDIIEHEPSASQSGRNIASGFVQLSNNEIAFKTSQTDKASSLVIDPWVTTPYTNTIPTDIALDASNNTYVLEWLGGEMYLQKFNPVGVLSWTYTMSLFGSGQSSVSDMAVDPSGNTYTAQPYYYVNADTSSYALLSLTPTGSLRYFYNTYHDSLGVVFETWDVAYSTKYNKLLEAGAPTVTQQQIGIINPATGNFNGTLYSNINLSEIYSGAISPNGNYYGLISNFCFCTDHSQQVAAYNISGNTASMLWHTPVTRYDFADFDFKNPGGIASNSVAASANRVFTTNGVDLYALDAATGQILDSAHLTGGDTAASGYVNGGIAVDTCGEFVYVGTQDSIKVYNYSLIPVTGFACPGIVYDIAMGNGVLSACGAPMSGTGFVAQFNALSCVEGVNNLAERNDNSVTVYPNPNNGMFMITCHSELVSESHPIIEVYNMLGQKVYSSQYPILTTQYQIDLSAQPAGIYLYRANTSDGKLLGEGKLIIK